MKKILLVVHPKWCKMIFNGKKTIEVRRTRPKLEPPFEVLVYMTKPKPYLATIIKEGDDLYGEIYHGKTLFFKSDRHYYNRNYITMEQRVIGSFICDKVDCYPYGDMSFPIPAYDGDPTVCECGNGYYITCGELEKTCLTDKELESYGNGKKLYGWHITDLKIYDKPKELSDFSKYGYKYLGGYCVNNNCKNYVYNGYYQPPECKIDGCFLKRPPQSWMYVEELQEEGKNE